MAKKNLTPNVWLGGVFCLMLGDSARGYSTESINIGVHEEKTIERFSSASEVKRTNRVLLRGLDKITAHVSDLEVTLGKPVTFGNLEITARFCQKSAPEDPPESIAFLEITEHKMGEKPILLFAGWMFSSSPAISALEHPVYDIWIKECTGEILNESIPIPVS